jgi:hypothetical protein
MLLSDPREPTLQIIHEQLQSLDGKVGHVQVAVGKIAGSLGQCQGRQKEHTATIGTLRDDVAVLKEGRRFRLAALAAGVAGLSTLLAAAVAWALGKL